MYLFLRTAITLYRYAPCFLFALKSTSFMYITLLPLFVQHLFLMILIKILFSIHMYISSRYSLDLQIEEFLNF